MSERQLDLLADAARQRPIERMADIGRFHSRNTTDTERAAAEQAPVGTQRERVLAAFRRVGEAGLTDAEGHVLARVAYPHIFGTRRAELQEAGYPIVDSGGRRLTPTNRLAIVWTLREDG